MSARRCVCLLLTLAACAKPGIGNRSDLGGGNDLAVGVQPDLAGFDLAGADFAGVDLAGGLTGDLKNACNPLTQSGCAAGEKCSVDSTGSSCISDGTKPNGAACGPASDDCVKGYECVGPSATALNCRQFCAADTDCTQAAVAAGATAEPSNTGHCLLNLTGSTSKVCTFACNPVAAAGASGCAAGFACQTFGGTTAPKEFTDCGTPGTGGDGANCATNGNSDCLAGFGCVNNGTAQHCRKLCRSGMAGTDCPAGGVACVVPTNATMFGFCCAGNC